MRAVAAAAMDRVQSGGMGQKSKNSSNKNHQQINVGATIVELVQTMRTCQDDDGSPSAAAMNAMMI